MLLLTCRSREHATRAVVTELVHRQDVRPEDAQGCPELVDEFVRRGVFRKRHHELAGRTVSPGLSRALLIFTERRLRVRS